MQIETPSSPTIAAETERLSHSAWGKWLWANLSSGLVMGLGRAGSLVGQSALALVQRLLGRQTFVKAHV